MTISVIISTYFREKPQYLNAALASIWTDQICKPDEIILVKDGPLTVELEQVISRWQKTIGEPFVVLPKEKNEGLAAALNYAVSVAKGDLIARMDSDDICVPERFLVQKRYMSVHPEVDILGGAIREFNDVGTLDNVRQYPTTFDAIKRSIHIAAPLAHPSVVFRRRFFDDGFLYSGKYHLCEDLSLWFDAVCAGRVINNIPDIILKFRRNDSMLYRRNVKAWSEFCAYSNGIYRLYGLFTLRYIAPFFRLVFRIMPIGFTRFVYNNVWFRNILSRSGVLTR